jgi:hypothetical protein
VAKSCCPRRYASRRMAASSLLWALSP